LNKLFLENVTFNTRKASNSTSSYFEIIVIDRNTIQIHLIVYCFKTFPFQNTLKLSRKIAMCIQNTLKAHYSKTMAFKTF